ncbi:MAG TPA: nucleoid-associated protein [Planctomycetaceae bacterium]|nr:nucleoid-associated protein [Planctomycetaceae bacterium]
MSDTVLKLAAAHLLRDTLVLSDNLLPKTPEVEDYLVEYFEAARSSATRRAGRFTGKVVSEGCKSALRGSDELLEASRQLAQRLFRLSSTDARISVSVFLFCLFFDSESNEMTFGAFKLDPSDGLTPNERNDDDGNTIVELAITKDVLPTSREALQKAAVISDPNNSPEFDLYVIDTQSHGRDVAKFFLEDFLEAEYALTDADRTKRFVRAINNARTEIRPSATRDEMLSVDAAFRSALRSEQVNTDQFVEKLTVSADARQVFKEQFDEHLPDREFAVDKKTAGRALRTRSFKGDHGLKVTVPADHYDDMVEVELGDDGRWVVTIKTKKWEEQG